MNVLLKQVVIKRKPLLRELIKDYQKEILNLEEVGEYKFLDSYWEKTDRFPYFIVVDGKLAGFILINNHSVIEKKSKSIAEFYVIKSYRKKGVGKMAAVKVFNLFPGKWEIRELGANKQAQKFWKKVVNEYTNGNYKEINSNNKKWNGLIQIFDNSN